jgi:hypothetical protein
MSISLLTIPIMVGTPAIVLHFLTSTTITPVNVFAPELGGVNIISPDNGSHLIPAGKGECILPVQGIGALNVYGAV